MDVLMDQMVVTGGSRVRCDQNWDVFLKTSSKTHSEKLRRIQDILLDRSGKLLDVSRSVRGTTVQNQ